MSDAFEVEVSIDAPLSTVWEALTVPALMSSWMGEPGMDVEVETSWAVGSPIVTRGFHNGPFVNRGVVLAFEPERRLRYSHLSSVSRLPDVPESYTVFEFRLEPGTKLTVRIENFPTESIRKHLEFYWRGTAHVLARRLTTRRPG